MDAGARMAGCDRVTQEDFARENVIRPLVTLLSFETFLDEDLILRTHPGRQSIHSIIQNVLLKSASRLSPASLPVQSLSDGGHGRFGSNKKDRDNESPKVKLELKTGCAEALWMLSRGNVSNCKRISETKGLLCLAKLVEKEAPFTLIAGPTVGFEISIFPKLSQNDRGRNTQK